MCVYCIYIYILYVCVCVNLLLYVSNLFVKERPRSPKARAPLGIIATTSCLPVVVQRAKGLAELSLCLRRRCHKNLGQKFAKGEIQSRRSYSIKLPYVLLYIDEYVQYYTKVSFGTLKSASRKTIVWWAALGNLPWPETVEVSNWERPQVRSGITQPHDILGTGGADGFSMLPGTLHEFCRGINWNTLMIVVLCCFVCYVVIQVECSVCLPYAAPTSGCENSEVAMLNTF